MSSSNTPPSKRIAIITKPGCAFCKKAKLDLNNAAILFEEIDLGDQLDTLAALKQISGQSTVPQIFIDGQLIGGSSELSTALQDGSLQKLLSSEYTTQQTSPLPPSLQQLLSASSVQNPSHHQDNNNKLDQLKNEINLRLNNPTSPFSLFEATSALLSSPKPGSSSFPRDPIDALASLQRAQYLTILSGAHPQTPLEELKTLNPNTTSSDRVMLQWVDCIPMNTTRIDQPLNTHYQWFVPPISTPSTANNNIDSDLSTQYIRRRSAIEVSADLRQRILSLYDMHMTPDGARIRYRALSNDRAFRCFVDLTAELQFLDVTGLSREESMSFWINIYNALIVHSTAVFGAAKNALERLRWFGRISYVIGGHRFSADDIEHGVLRGNAPSPGSIFSLLGVSSLAQNTFSLSDPRSRLSIRPIDPRIHFALNCGAVSCPPIRVYTPEKLEAGLEAAAFAFCSGGNVLVDAERKVVMLSSIFKWYGYVL